MTAVHRPYERGAPSMQGLDALGNVRLPLALAVARGSLLVVSAINGQPVPRHCLQQPRPTLIIVADDRPSAAGPKRWCQLSELLRWANAVVIHVNHAQPQHYEAVANTAIIRQRVVLVETAPARHGAWLHRLQNYSGRVISILSQRCESYPHGGGRFGGTAQ